MDSNKEQLTIEEKYNKIVEIANAYISRDMEGFEAIGQIAELVGPDIRVGDICQYKNDGELFIVTNIREGNSFDGVYHDGQVISDGTLGLIEPVGHYDAIDDFLGQIKINNK